MFRCLLAASLLLALPAGAAPRSAIPWLSDSVRSSAVDSMSAPLPRPAVPPAERDGMHPIHVRPLPPASREGAGLLSSRATGLPYRLWKNTSVLRARVLTERVRATGVPAAQELYRTLLLAQTAPPLAAGGAADFLRTRIDRLMQMGALEEALELVRRTAIPTPEFLLRRFDLSLLTGQEDSACQALLEADRIQPTAAARIFCLARRGAWADAVVTLAVAQQTGDVSDAEADIFARFLETIETEPDEMIEIPRPITPLTYLMLSAIGAGGLAVDADLPVAFATLDLTETTPPRARMRAAERLVAAGGLGYPLLFYAYRAGTPAASGGVWDRSAAVQALDAALASGDLAEIAPALGAADTLLAPVGLRVALAQEYAPALARHVLAGDGAAIPPALREEVAEILMLGEEGAAAARVLDADAPLRSRAALSVSGFGRAPEAPDGSLEAAALAAFDGTPHDHPLHDELSAAIAEGRLGEALMRALRVLDAGRGVDPGDLTAALRIIREVDQDSTARQIAVQTLLTGRPR